MRGKKWIKSGAIAALASSAFIYLLLKPSYDKLSSYLWADFQSERSRAASAGKPKSGLKGILLSAEEDAKTVRDFLLFARNDNDKLPEYDIYVDRKTNTARVYLEEMLAKEFPVGTGRVLKGAKTRFGEYVTPVGDYIVISKNTDVNPDLYGDGMLQLSGPWAPYIAIHGTYDNSKIGTYKSNGCINVTNENLKWLFKNVGIGSRVHIK